MQGLDRARRGDRLADRLRRRAALVELRDLPDHGHARRHRAGRQPRAHRRPVLRDLRRRSPPPAAAPDRRAVPLQDLRGGHAEEVDQVREQADEAGGDRPSMLALLYPLEEEVPGYPREQFEDDLTNETEKDIRGAFEAGAERVSVDFTEGRLATRADPRNPWTGARDAAALHRAQQPRARPLLSRGAHEDRHPHLSGRRPRLGAQRRRPVQRPAPADVQDQRRLLPDPARQRAGQGPGVQVDRRAQPGRRERRAAGLLRGRHQPAEPAGREPAGGLRRARAGRRLHPEGAPGRDRRLRVLAVQHRREAQPRLARLRPRGGVPEDAAAAWRARAWRPSSSA